jgi:hypothetical protein
VSLRLEASPASSLAEARLPGHLRPQAAPASGVAPGRRRSAAAARHISRAPNLGAYADPSDPGRKPRSWICPPVAIGAEPRVRVGRTNLLPAEKVGGLRGRFSVRCDGENSLQVMGFLVEREEHVDASGWAAGVLVGRHVADRGEGSPAGSGGVGCVVGRSGGVVAGRGAVSSRGARGSAGGVDGWAADDRDGDVYPDDGAQAALPVGVSVVGGGGVGLDSSAPLLSDQLVGAGAGRVDRSQAHSAVRPGDGVGHHPRADREGGPGEAVPAAGRAGRLDGRRGGCEVSDRRGPGVERGEGAGAGRGASCGR